MKWKRSAFNARVSLAQAFGNNYDVTCSVTQKKGAEGFLIQTTVTVRREPTEVTEEVARHQAESLARAMLEALESQRSKP